ncbi:cytochrome P450 1A1 isoform X1 [Mesocricetus auratus]|uniref:Cytochrome P450 1A1 n=2 Tax=Mesocricetus auratus TaxID=10036 RepID=CP1A1_MESAU|nr:cytochrome P450 1A1 isoform X1 [Mesocricetus auratus]XP_040585614.1 cytochrome P450 1A1 isoform X1 [Mesocricetus auratus]Q00557.2 RecName: Full=Cytochrome P450 1A1; AltName: Full=CYPIA1; AltName: Full=Cytochrome P-450MC; AltName: Full=Cytochrome P450 form 6; AltName: Full=Cytochrome P450-C; AltName: Full=Cytochrome P450-P1; AltName: Full=Hydroperoxy icosatetraenoate dehydratase [Mesocricetus auratus]pir/JS0746/ cytochrome P450 1A1 - Chinese hamster [Cricetulus griseus]BAA01717.1 cytochrome P
MSSIYGLLNFMSATELLLAITVFCLGFWVVRALRTQVPKGLKTPPGPWGLPILGHVLTLGKNPHLSLTKLSKQYGDVLQIRIGSTPVVVLSGLDTIRQALVRQGDDFKGRPDFYSFTLITNGKSMTFNPDCGPVWAARRRLAQDALKSFSIALDPASASSCYLEEYVIKEADYLISKFQKLMAEVGHFDPDRYLVVSVTNVICAMCFGQRYDHDDQELLSIVNLSNEFGKVTGSGYPPDFIPILRYLPNSSLDAFKDLNKKFYSFMQKSVKEHYRTFEKGHIRDITDSLIEHCQDKSLDENANVQLSDDRVINIIVDLFGAGFDTVTTAISWSLMYLVTNPGVQRKIQEELDTVIGRSRRPRLCDRSQLPYLEAFILETFRHSSFLPFTIPHSTTRDTSLCGFYIPKGHCVFVNQWQINHNQELWGDPNKFRPERFLTSSGTLDKVLSGKVTLFGLGKRKCIGETIGRLEVFLFLAILLQQIEFTVSPGEKVDMTPIYGLTLKHARCEYFQAQTRSSGPQHPQA